MEKNSIIPPPPPIFWKYTTHLLHRRNIAALTECQWFYPAARINSS